MYSATTHPLTLGDIDRQICNQLVERARSLVDQDRCSRLLIENSLYDRLKCYWLVLEGWVSDTKERKLFALPLVGAQDRLDTVADVFGRVLIVYACMPREVEAKRQAEARDTS